MKEELRMLSFIAINKELIYILVATGVILVAVYYLRRLVVTKNDEVDDEVLDESEIAREELESMIVRENIILEEKDIEKEVARDLYDLDEEKETKQD
jgi:hypothetical protein